MFQRIQPAFENKFCIPEAKRGLILRVSLILALFFCLSTSLAYAATLRWTKFSGTVTGRYVKKTIPLVNATVTVTNSDDGTLLGQAKTDSAGHYSIRFQLSQSTPFTIKAEGEKYRPWVKSGTANPGWNRIINFILARDITKPKGTIKINNDAQYTNSTAVNLTLSAQDNANGSGVSQMKFSNDNVNWSGPEPYSMAKEWLLTSGDGQKFVYVKFMDAAQNWSVSASDDIILDTSTPVISVNIEEDNLSLGALAVGGTTVSTTAITVKNDGSGINQTYSLSLINPAGWIASHAGTGPETYLLNAAFANTVSGINWNAAEHAVSTVPVSCSVTKFAGDQTGVSVPYNEVRKLWFQFKAPTTTVVNTEQSIAVIITAQAG